MPYSIIIYLRIQLRFHGVFIATYFVYLITLVMFWYKLKQEGIHLRPQANVRDAILLIRQKIKFVGYEFIRLFHHWLLFMYSFIMLSTQEQDFLEFSAAREFLF